MTDSGKVALEQELGGACPPVARLTDAECAELLVMFRKAREEEKVALAEAIDDALGALPWPMRGPAKKIMFGKRG